MIETELLNKNDIQNDSEFWANLEFEQAKRKNRKIKSNDPEILKMDKMYEDENSARAEVLAVLNRLNSFNADNQNTMMNQFFFQGKSNELIKIFSKATQQDKIRASDILQKIDITNATRYKEELKR